MAVVPAGVHAAGRPRGPGDARFLDDRKSVDVGAEGDGAVGASGQEPERAGPAREPVGARDAGGLEFGADPRARPDLLVAGLGMRVQLAAEFDRPRRLLGDEGAHAGEERGVRGAVVCDHGGDGSAQLLSRASPHASRPSLTRAKAWRSWRMSRVSWLIVMPRMPAAPATSNRRATTTSSASARSAG